MNKVFLASYALIVAAMIFGCKPKESIHINPVARRPDTTTCSISDSFSYRKGKWIEVQKPLEASRNGPDTLWFKKDSLLAWSVDGEPYIMMKMYFNPCGVLWHEGFGPPQPPGFGYRQVYYDTVTRNLRLVFIGWPYSDTAYFRRYSSS